MSNDKLKLLWTEFIKSLSNRITSGHLLTYFQGSAPLKVKDNGCLIIAIPNAFIKETLVKKYSDDILNYFSCADESIKSIDFKTKILKKEDFIDVSEILKKTSKSTTEDGIKIKRISINDKYLLSNFIVGDNSQLACAAAKAVVKKTGQLYNPLFIYGGVGLGKTHLLQGIANEIKRKHTDCTILYTTAENFTNSLIEAISTNKIIKFRKKYRDNIDVLILDDIQFFEGKEKTQEELFHTFNVLYEANKQIILSSDRPPIELKTLEDRLKSRFASGMVADVTKPDIETRIAILRSKLQQRGFLIPQDALEVIAELIDSNVRELEAVLNQVIDEAELLGIDPSLDLVKTIIKRLYPTKIEYKKSNKYIDPDGVINSVSECFNITPSEIVGVSRQKEIIIARHIAMYVMRDVLDLSLEKIGYIFGKRNHTTVMHGINKIKKEINNNLSLVKAINQIKRDLGV